MPGSPVRPIEVLDLLIAVCDCPAGLPVYVDSDEKYLAVVGVERYGASPGILIETEDAYDSDQDAPASIILAKVRKALRGFKRGSLYADKATGQVHLVTQSEIRDFAAKLTSLLEREAGQ